MFRPIRVAALLLPSMLAMSACSWVGEDLSKGLNYGGGSDGDKDEVRKRDLAASKITTIGVNAWLWRAALDTVSFMPLLQTDSNGGVIVTDWYVNPASGVWIAPSLMKNTLAPVHSATRPCQSSIRASA